MNGLPLADERGTLLSNQRGVVEHQPAGRHVVLVTKGIPQRMRT